ncbi:MAG: molybdopterin-binding/glycosyltransferase family 2 protein [Rhodospirillales bacterium]|nr:MAG: molybdopterin-binding/glycosyltransferase family 2 protein [Rhodospirillales bacterium]
MKFGETPVDEAVGAILAHSVSCGGRTYRKGRVLSKEDGSALRAAGITTVVAARLDAGDVGEDAAAETIGDNVAGRNLAAGEAFTGRVNLFAQARGLVVYDSRLLQRVNCVHESITIAALPPYAVVEPRQMVATIKIIPFAVAGATVDACVETIAAAGGLFEVAPFLPRRAGLIQTTLPGTRETLLDKTQAVLRGRIEALGGTLLGETRCAHAIDDVAEAIRAWRRRGCDLLLLMGASAITDRRDVIPAAIEAVGGGIDHFGMPVDPGNLMLIGHHDDLPVLGLPGCVRSPKVNGFDWVLQRLCAGLAVTSDDVMGMGAGGLLTEISARPLPRAEACAPARAPATPRVAAIVLAAGQSRRMGRANKLLADLDGLPMIARVVDAVLGSRADPVLVVVGHQAAEIEAALAERDVRIVHNRDFAAGISTSLKQGLRALPPEIDGALVCLGDMPRITPDQLDRLIRAFNPVEGRAICVPTRRGKRGNPVLFARRFFEEIESLGGDVGARHLIGESPDLVCEVDMPDDGVLLDIDTPQALDSLRR